jgi:hypothetical protein
MSSEVGRGDAAGLAGVHPKRLFAGSCFGIGASAMTFVAISAVMGPLKEHFVLTNEQVGWIGGPAENYGGRISFRRVALLSILLTVVFGVLYVRDLARGGYRAEKLDSKEAV